MTYDQGSLGEARAQEVDRLLAGFEAAGQRCDQASRAPGKHRDERLVLAVISGVALALHDHAQIMRAILKEVLDHE